MKNPLDCKILNLKNTFIAEKLSLIDYLPINIEWTMYLDDNLEINRIDLNGSISEDTDQYEDDNENEDFWYEDIQPEKLDADLAEQSLFISTYKTIAGIPSTKIGYNLIENNISVCNFVILQLKERFDYWFN